MQVRCSQLYKIKSHKDEINSPMKHKIEGKSMSLNKLHHGKANIKSINEVLKYNSEESPIKKKAISRVTKIVRDLEKTPDKNSRRPG